MGEIVTFLRIFLLSVVYFLSFMIVKIKFVDFFLLLFFCLCVCVCVCAVRFRSYFSFCHLNCDFRTVPLNSVPCIIFYTIVMACAFVVELRFLNILFYDPPPPQPSQPPTFVDIGRTKRKEVLLLREFASVQLKKQTNK